MGHLTDPQLTFDDGFLPANGYLPLTGGEQDFYMDTLPSSGDAEAKASTGAPPPPNSNQADTQGSSGGGNLPPETLNDGVGGITSANPNSITSPRLVYTQVTPTDDEDLVEGSGTDGSGLPPVSVAYYRSGFLLTNVQFVSELQYRNSTDFQTVSENVRIAVEDLYADLPGDQFVTILQFLNRTGNTMIQFDLGSAGFYSESALYRVLDTAVRSSQVGRYSVDPNELDFAPLPGKFQHQKLKSFSAFF
eukprot:XP_003727635.2 PREDICTED: basement membrane-specific heparan sulfate proteoglycan core protein [Strongylocentrotus purpuratus]